MGSLVRHLAAVAIATAVATASAQARIVAIEITAQEPFAEGAAFGAAGAYVRITGRARGELDPRDPRNSVIVNLDRAPRNARGMVEYETDLFILRPADPARGNGRMLYEVNNRGRKFLFHWLMDGPAQAAGATNDPRTAEHAGNALFLRMGYTMVWSGWDPDAPRANNGMAMTAPVATNGGQPIVRRIRDELVSGTRGPPVDRFRLSYEAATLDQAQARLTVRRRQSDERSELPPTAWTYVDSRTIRLLPDGARPEPGSLFEFHYPAKDPRVLGIGFAATRDVVSFLRHEARDARGAANPVGRRITHTIAIGISQSGRYLRDHIAQGFNQDEARRRVFDGVLSHIAGVGRVFLNYEFGQPARTNTQHEDHDYPENEFPFSAAALTDPVTGTRGALLRGDRFDPLLMDVNTSTEYWQKGASLLHTDPLGQRDLTLPRNARVYMIAGTQHGGRAGLDSAPGPCVNPRNPHNPAPALRALIVALDQWVTRGTPPPASRVPTLRQGTLGEAGLTGFRPIAGMAVARSANRVTPPRDWIDPQPASRVYRPLVAQVDFDGNETDGILLPDIAAPLGTYTGWNLYRAPFPEGALCDRDGSFVAFARTRAQREQGGDVRGSIEERYRNHPTYVNLVQEVATALVRQRLLLQEDADRYVARARARNPFID
jgi:Alpha/beta hydrolase domain